MQKNKVLISIIMPVFNAEQYLPSALIQLQQQGFGNYELLLIDGLSADKTPFFAKSMMEQMKSIRWFSQKDKGIYDAMNFGVKKAEGEWVYFMGCDDRFHDNCVLQNVSTFLCGTADIVYGNVQWVPEGQLETGLCTPLDLYQHNINHQRIFYRRSLFERYGGYDLRYQISSDHELNIRLFCNEEIVKQHINITIADYHAGGFSANKMDAVFWSQWKSIFKANFSTHIPIRRMYEKLGWYCRYLIERHQYAKAFPIFFDVLLHTFSPGFVLLTGKHLLNSFNQNEG